MVPFFREHRDIAMLQQDNARPNTAASVTKTIITASGFDVLDWHAKSPGISPIEHFWDNLGKCVRKRNMININEIRQALVEEYTAIPQENMTILVR